MEAMRLARETYRVPAAFPGCLGETMKLHAPIQRSAALLSAFIALKA